MCLCVHAWKYLSGVQIGGINEWRQLLQDALKQLDVIAEA
jgi:hypothetical protein